MTSLVNSIKHFKKFYKIIEEEGPLPKSFYEATITLILKSETLQGKQEKNKSCHTNFTDEYLWENPQQNTRKLNSAAY